MTALPAGVRVTLEASVHVSGGGRVLAGGSPARILRLAPGGPEAVAALAAGTATAAQRRLGRRLVDAGMARTQPPPLTSPPDVTLVIPVRDRAAELDRCLAATLPRDGAAGQLRIVVVDDASRDPEAVAAVARRHGARLIRRARAGGPGAARNDGLAAVDSELVAFLDSDTLPAPGWIDALAAHFADPLLAAVAPRIVPLARSAYARARSPLDMGARPGEVGPGRPVGYVPAAALLARAAHVRFDPALRYGEDVDLVWRLAESGMRVRYDPSVSVGHAEPGRLAARLRRRARYGTSAAPLARRHPGRLAPAILRPLPTATAALALTRHPRAAAAVAAIQAGLMVRAGVPPRLAPRWTARAVVGTALGAAHAAGTFGAPVCAATRLARAVWPGAKRQPARATARWRPTHAAGLAAALTTPHLAHWLAQRPPLDPLTYTALALLDDAAYGAGVIAGCVRTRTAAPLLPLVRPAPDPYS